MFSSQVDCLQSNKVSLQASWVYLRKTHLYKNPKQAWWKKELNKGIVKVFEKQKTASDASSPLERWGIGHPPQKNHLFDENIFSKP